MCGIFGFSIKEEKLTHGRTAILGTALGVTNARRGDHSWGVLGLKDGEYNLKKGVGDITDSVHVMDGYHTLMAHTRYKTIGAVTVENAHPFHIGKIIGAHNGQVYNHAHMNWKYKRKFDVDSMHLFAHLNSEMDFSDLEGYGAIEWVNTDRLDAIHLVKMVGGELSIYGVGKEKNPDGIVWSSDKRHLLKAFTMAGITEFFKYEIDEGVHYSVENYRLFVHDEKYNVRRTKFYDWRDGDVSTQKQFWQQTGHGFPENRFNKTEDEFPNRFRQAKEQEKKNGKKKKGKLVNLDKDRAGAAVAASITSPIVETLNGPSVDIEKEIKLWHDYYNDKATLDESEMTGDEKTSHEDLGKKIKEVTDIQNAYYANKKVGL